MRRRNSAHLIFAACVFAAPGTGAASAQTVVDTPSVVSSVDRPCRTGDEEILVCGRREERRSPYRLPEPPPRFDPGGNDESVSRDRHALYEHGDTGIHSCSTVGPAGWTGCTFRQWKDSDEQWGGKPRGSRKRPGEY